VKYRKKPVEIQAVQFTGSNYAEVFAFVGHDAPVGVDEDGGTKWVQLTTVHGDTAYARPGDWIIPEPQPGRFYPCNPDIFAASYDAVTS